ncbi:MAG: hypothetical protein LPK03_11690 [Pontibacter sp.]|nr:hypothetical protein [Pontibacter sp.]
MKNILYLLALPFLLLACSPENEEVQDEQVDVAPPANALDSIADTQKDAVRTDENEISPTLPLPPPVMRLLADKYSNWEKPDIAASAQLHAEELNNSPGVARGDFDGDSRQDVALQLTQGKEVVIVVALQPEDGSYKLVELKRDILFNERGVLRSLYYLYTINQGEDLQSIANGNDVELTHDALAVGIEDDVTAYVYQNGVFQSYATGL